MRKYALIIGLLAGMVLISCSTDSHLPYGVRAAGSVEKIGTSINFDLDQSSDDDGRTDSVRVIGDGWIAR